MPMFTEASWLANLLFLVVGIVLGYFVGTYLYRKITEAKLGAAKESAAKILEDAEAVAESRKKEALLEAKDEIFKLRNETEKELKVRRNEVTQMEQRVLQKEDALDKKAEGLERKEISLQEKDGELDKMRKNIQLIQQDQLAELERISGFTSEQAKEKLLNDLNKEVEVDMAAMIREMEAEARDEGESRARAIITEAIQRVAA
ncbi:MAG: DUF3552 domain-containing protein, partial [Firmicutes bacterium]|nr:DUF3552 domain-containing protein [Bacillota bacterium]